MEDDELEKYCEVCSCVPTDNSLHINCIPGDEDHDVYMCGSCANDF